ncbi:hypothetical protein DL96DRAFT_881572 [Flagelloscypha sp. PMI_526]|nr:hypothetical protein DL96DRAFT_881572 [Flagelloscypha sp. PMI_526]
MEKLNVSVNGMSSISLLVTVVLALTSVSWNRYSASNSKLAPKSTLLLRFKPSLVIIRFLFLHVVILGPSLLQIVPCAQWECLLLAHIFTNTYARTIISIWIVLLLSLEAFHVSFGYLCCASNMTHCNPPLYYNMMDSSRLLTSFFCTTTRVSILHQSTPSSRSVCALSVCRNYW